jgi:hypothetical protein
MKDVDGRDKPGHDEKASHFQSVGKSLKMLDAFSVILSGAANWHLLVGLRVKLRPTRFRGSRHP